MKAQKIVLRTVYCLAGLLFIASVGYNIFQHQQFKILSEKSASGKITKTESVDDINSNSGSGPGVKVTAPDDKAGSLYTNENKELEYHLNAAKEELDMTNKQLSEELTKKEEFKKAYYQSGGDDSDPVHNKIRRETFTKLINEDYASLFKKLNVSEEEFNGLKSLLFDKRIELDDLSGPYRNASTAEERDEVIQQEKDISEKYKVWIAEFLGEEQNEIYQAYEDRRMERSMLSDFMETVPPDKRVKEEQMETLIDDMYAARKKTYDEMSTGPEITSLSDLTDEKITQIIERAEQVNKRYVEVSRGIMSPDQLEGYKSYLKQQLEMQDASLKMSIYLNEDN